MARIPSPSSQLNSNASFSSNVVPKNNYEKSSRYSDITELMTYDELISFTNLETTIFFRLSFCTVNVNKNIQFRRFVISKHS